ncbi:MAG: hypothetical protein ABSF79_05770 [Smithellaceae bacterium]|jgi:hypothetical protein
MSSSSDEKKTILAMPVIAASYIGPALAPNLDAAWDEAQLPLNPDDLVQKIMGQPMRRAGRFIKMVCCGALACLKKVPPGYLKTKKIGIFLATGLGNVDEILPFITQVFKHEGGFPSPNQFANSVSNAAAFFLARICEIKGVILTISEEELSFESALWLAQSYLENGEIDLALVGGCDVFTPTVEEYHERMNLKPDNARLLPMGEGSSWLLLGKGNEEKIGDILAVEFGSKLVPPEEVSASENILSASEKLIAKTASSGKKRFLLPGFRMDKTDTHFWKQKGWEVDDYLPYCGIYPTAAAFGIARAMQKNTSTIFVHYNCHASGKQVFVAASTK